MPPKPDPETWTEVRDLLRCWETLTTELAQGVAGRPAEHLLSLLQERQQICDRLDALREGCGIANWIGKAAGDCPAAICEEIVTIYSRLAPENERISSEMAKRMGVLEQKIDEIHQTRAAGRLYRRRCRVIKGAFIDARG